MIAYIRLGIGVLILLLIVSNFFLLKKVITLSGERTQLLEAAQDSGNIARTYINLHGQEVSKNKVLTQDLRNVKELQNNTAFKMAKETQGVKKNLKNLQEVSNTKLVSDFALKLQLKDTIISKPIIGGVLPQVRLDTVLHQSYKTFSYSDKYHNSLKGIIEQDTIRIEAEVPTDIDGVVYWQRKHKFLFIRYGHKESFSELKSTNPWVKIKSQQTIKIEKYGR